MTLTERLQASTPKFFKKVRNIGLILAAVSSTLITAPVALPVVVVKIGSHMGMDPMVASTISQTAVSDEPQKESEGNRDGRPTR